MKKLSWVRPTHWVFALALAILSSCEEKVDLSAIDTENVENEAAIDAFFEDTDDMASMSVAADRGTNEGSRVSGRRVVDKTELDSRFACPGTTVDIDFADDSNTITPHGTITVNFGSDGCTDARGNVRKGSIVIEFKGRRFQTGSTIVTTLVDYEINGIKLEGTRTVTVTNDVNQLPTFSIMLVGGKATWPDGTIATREVNRTRRWLSKSRPLTPSPDTWIISGSASGTNRRGSVYELNITRELLYKRECAHASRIFIAVEGTKELIVDGKKIIIDYGSGECDRLVRITTLGGSREVEVKGDI